MDTTTARRVLEVVAAGGGEPVTIGGWYGDVEYAWIDGRVRATHVRIDGEVLSVILAEDALCQP